MRRPRLIAFAPRIAAGFMLCALAACESGEKFAPACPELALLPDAADLTRYAGGGQDVTDLVLDARITAVPASCVRDDARHVRATVRVAMDVNRGPAATSGRTQIPYIVAVMQGSRILDEQDFMLDVSFPPNTDRLQRTGDPVDLVLPVTPTTSAAAYRILVGYRLAPAELALNRQRGVR